LSRFSLTPCSRVLLEKLTGSQLVKKFPTFYGTRRYITSFTRACQLSVFFSQINPVHSHHPTSQRSILIVSSHLRPGLPSDFFPSSFPTKTLYSPHLSPCPYVILDPPVSFEQILDSRNLSAIFPLRLS